jgi:sRNA-binding carbon storage regulator CsrA
MLAVTLKEGEKVLLGDYVGVLLLGIRGNKSVSVLWPRLES